MIPYIIPLLGSFLSTDYLDLWFYPLFALAFLATVPRLIRIFFER